jgi:hypothetical protein
MRIKGLIIDYNRKMSIFIKKVNNIIMLKEIMIIMEIVRLKVKNKK